MLLAKDNVVSIDRVSIYKFELASRNAFTKDNTVDYIVTTKIWPLKMLFPSINIQERAQAGNSNKNIHRPLILIPLSKQYFSNS